MGHGCSMLTFEMPHIVHVVTVWVCKQVITLLFQYVCKSCNNLVLGTTARQMSPASTNFYRNDVIIAILHFFSVMHPSFQ